MIFGIGVDIAEVSRFESMIEQYGIRIAEKILTEKELQQYKKRNQSASFLATRFAAKEAASKALGTGITQGVGFKSIEVTNQESGQPMLGFYDRAREILAEKGIDRTFISLSDEKHFVVAMVVLER